MEVEGVKRAFLGEKAEGERLGVFANVLVRLQRAFLADAGIIRDGKDLQPTGCYCFLEFVRENLVGLPGQHEDNRACASQEYVQHGNFQLAVKGARYGC